MKTFFRLGKLLIFIMLPSFTLIQSCKKADTFTKPIQEELTKAPNTKQYSADVATAWFSLLTEITKTKPYFSAQAVRIFAYSGIALYESVVPGMSSYQSMYKYFTGNIIEVDNKKDYYWPACANAAIARISSLIMQDYTAPNLTQVQALENSLNTSYQSLVTLEQLQRSNEFGRYIADIIYAWSKTDGTLNPNGTLTVCPPYVPLGGPGNWVPTPPGFFPAAGACQGNLRTFIPNIVNTVLPAPHPVYSTDPFSAFYQFANEVYQRRNNITTEEIRSVSNWRDLSPNFNPPAHSLKLTTEIIKKEKPNLEDASVIFVKQTIAAFDAVTSIFKAKFHYALIRPITYIRGVMGYGTWNSFVTTPQTPSYPDEVSATASTVAILENYFGVNYAVTDSVHQSTHGVFSYPSLNAILTDVVEARLSGGTIFRFGGEAGVIQGRAVGEMVNQLPFKKP